MPYIFDSLCIYLFLRRLEFLAITLRISNNNRYLFFGINKAYENVDLNFLTQFGLK